MFILKYISTLGETMDKVLVINAYNLPGEYTLYEHYRFDADGTIDWGDIRWSVVANNPYSSLHVKNCMSYHEAMIKFLSYTTIEYEGMGRAMCKLIDVTYT